jgi:endogenous inhibitor of DNA gyrase (YacG/DUF329 family)
MSPDRIAACPHCGASTRLDGSNAWRPFCSERCKLIDLGDWLSGRYAIPIREDEPADSELQDPAQPLQ